MSSFCIRTPDSTSQSLRLFGSGARLPVGLCTGHFDGLLVHLQRRFLDVASVWAQALFLHHLFPAAAYPRNVIPRRGGLREIGGAGLALRSLPSSSPLDARGARRFRRAVLHVLRGSGPLPQGPAGSASRFVTSVTRGRNMQEALRRHAPRFSTCSLRVGGGISRSTSTGLVGSSRAWLALGEVVRIVVTRGRRARPHWSCTRASCRAGVWVAHSSYHGIGTPCFTARMMRLRHVVCSLLSQTSRYATPSTRTVSRLRRCCSGCKPPPPSSFQLLGDSESLE